MKRGLVVALVILASGLNRACETGVIGGKGGAPAGAVKVVQKIKVEIHRKYQVLCIMY